MDLTPEQLIRRYSKNPGSYNNDEFWLKKLAKDYPLFLPHFKNKKNKKYKDIYIWIFYQLHRQTEQSTRNFLDSYGNFKKFLTKEYSQQLYKFFYKFLLISVNEMLKHKKVNESLLSDISIKIEKEYFQKFKRSFLPELLQEEKFDMIWSNIISKEMENFNRYIARSLKIFEEDNRLAPL